MMRFQVRFHLGRGKHFGWWQVKSLAGVRYYPTTAKLTMLDCQLRNQRGAARRIHAGEDKKVCAWIDCNEVLVEASGTPATGLPVSFNPRVAPHWRNYRGADIDGRRIEVLRTNGREVVVTPEMTKTVNGVVSVATPESNDEARRMIRLRKERE